MHSDKSTNSTVGTKHNSTASPVLAQGVPIVLRLGSALRHSACLNKMILSVLQSLNAAHHSGLCCKDEGNGICEKALKQKVEWIKRKARRRITGGGVMLLTKVTLFLLYGFLDAQ